MEDIICVGAVYFGVFCLIAALLCAAAAVLERFPRVANKLGTVLFPAAKRRCKLAKTSRIGAPFSLSASPKTLSEYGTEHPRKASPIGRAFCNTPPATRWCSPKCRYYGTLKVGDEDSMDFCYKYETKAGKLPRRFASERKLEHEQLQR